MMSIRSFNLSRQLITQRHFSDLRPIKIPERIERGPTDILEALASTVRRDETAPHYKYHDDPFLIPKNYLNQRSYALSKESGRKAARYFLDKYPDLFYRDDAEPKIPAFSYKDTYNPELEYNESDLLNCIHSFQVLNAIEMYKDLNAKGAEISQGAKQALLELVCYFNCTERADPEYLDGAWFAREEHENMPRKLWQDSSFAVDLFNGIQNKSAETYAAMIRGLSKFNAGNQTFKLFEEAKSKGIQLDVNTYNAVIKVVPFLRDNLDAKWDLALQLMVEMNSNRLVPNVNTFVELLQVIYRTSNWAPGLITSLKLMSEMKRLEIEPSLSCFYYLNLIHHRQNSNSYILPQILDELSGKRLKLRNLKDYDLFPSLMKTCYFSYNDLDIGYRIHELLMVGNQHLIGSGFGEQTYYQNFFLLLSENDTYHNVKRWYRQYIPNIYAPSPTVLAGILNCLSMDRVYEDIPELWNDIVSMEMVKDKTVTAFINVLSEAPPGSEPFNESIINVAHDIFNRIKSAVDDSLSRPEFSTPSELWNANLLSPLIMVLIRFDRSNEALEMLKTISKNEAALSGEISPEVFESLALKSMKERDLKSLSFLVKYSTHFGQTLEPFIKNQLNKLDESSHQEIVQTVSNVFKNREDD